MKMTDITKWTWETDGENIYASKEIDGKEMDITIYNTDDMDGFYFMVDEYLLFAQGGGAIPYDKETFVPELLTEKEYNYLKDWAAKQDNKYREEIKKKYPTEWEKIKAKHNNSGERLYDIELRCAECEDADMGFMIVEGEPICEFCGDFGDWCHECDSEMEECECDDDDDARRNPLTNTADILGATVVAGSITALILAIAKQRRGY